MKEKNPKSSQVSKPFFLRSESASSTVVGAVLLLAIVVTIFSVVRLGYIPEWKNDAEYSHMNDVWGDMTELKSKIDLMTVVLASDPDSTSPITMSVPFHMGGGDVPLVGTIKSSGTLSVANNLEHTIKITKVSDSNDTIPSIQYGTVNYASQNRYYVDQNFIYEGGALILSQGEQSSMMLYPSVRFSKVHSNDYDVSIHVVEITKSVYTPVDVISSNTGCSLRLTGKEFKSLYDSDDDGNLSSFTFTINTDYPDAWYLYLKETMEDAGIKNYDLDPPMGNNVSLTFPSGSGEKGLNRLYVSKTRVKVETGIGI